MPTIRVRALVRGRRVACAQQVMREQQLPIARGIRLALGKRRGDLGVQTRARRLG